MEALMMEKIKRKVLVTGGAGFIGSHACERLLGSNYEVYSLDNYSTGDVKNHIEGVEYIKGETKDIFNLVDFSPEIIFHFGEYSRVEQSFKEIDLVWESNKIGIFYVLEFVRHTGAKLIYSGSSTKFGDGGLGRGQSPYAWTKATNTELVKNYRDWFGISFAIVYFYNVYAGREIKTGKYATLIAIFTKKYLEGGVLTVVSPGTQKRNFTHIDDIIDGIMLVAEKGYGDNFGIGNVNSYSILEIANMFKNGKVKMLPERKGNRNDADLVVNKTVALGWSCKKNIEDHIKKITKGVKK
jgi:UDP-glucose 4-epimerase